MIVTINIGFKDGYQAGMALVRALHDAFGHPEGRKAWTHRDIAYVYLSDKRGDPDEVTICSRTPAGELWLRMNAPAKNEAAWWLTVEEEAP